VEKPADKLWEKQGRYLRSREPLRGRRSGLPDSTDNRAHGKSQFFRHLHSVMDKEKNRASLWTAR
jgi:hypothetical protein